MGSEQFALSWDDFHKNMSDGMHTLLENEDLVDVTLAVEGRYLKAHKMVLAVCSPYFRDLFQSSPCKHPIIFMRDVTHAVLTDLLQFMYRGEVHVVQENLTDFIKTAEALQIKGLTSDNGNQNDSELSEAEVEQAVQTLKRSREAEVKVERSPKSRNGPTGRKRMKNLNADEDFNEDSMSNVEDSFKYKPEDESADHTVESIDEFPSEILTDDGLDPNEDGEEYSMVDESGDEPKAGTSSEVPEGQDPRRVTMQGSKRKKRVRTRTRYVVNGFVYHNNIVYGTPPMRYLGCAHHKRSGCKARAVVPVNSPLSELKITTFHNHPPDANAEERNLFLRQLKLTVRSMKHATLRTVYETVAEIYPNAATEISFKSINSSLHRWRHDLEM